MVLRARQVGLLLGAGGLAAAALIACAKTTIVSDGIGGPLFSGTCPATFEKAGGAACALEGQSCPYIYPCSTFPADLTCVCSGGHFACGSADGAPFDDATACPGPVPAETCPKLETSAQGLFCDEPGLVCYYPSACESTPAYDSCQCVGPASDSDTMHFECTASCESPGAGPPVPGPDASTDAETSAPQDASSDGPAEASSPALDGAGE